ncbi:MAG: FHA domain-containing protein [Chloroflexota bacterium]
MAELIAGSEKTRLTVNGESVLVGRHSDDGTFTPDIDLGGMEGGRTVSRRHAWIFKRNGKWFLRVESTTTNATAVGGQPLATGQEAELLDGAEIILGKIPLVFNAEGGEPPPEPVFAGPAKPSAEFRANERTVPLAAADGGSLSLGRHSDDGSYQPDVDLSDLAYGRTVSRHHGLLSYRGGQWFLKVEAAVTNPTILNGTTLDLGQEVALNDQDQLQLGRVIATFHQLKQIPSVGPELIEVMVAPAQFVTDAGNEVRATVTVVNHTGHVDWFRIEVEGIPIEWCRIFLPDGTEAQPAQVRLFHTPAHTATPSPDAMAQLKLYIRPPKDSQTWAGAREFAVSATTQGEPRMRRATSGVLTINRFENVDATIQPDRIARPRGEFKVQVVNAGNDPLAVEVETAGDGLFIDVDRPQFTLANGVKDEFTVKARVRHRHWLGAEKDYILGVTVRAGGSKEQLISYVVCPPRIPRWIQLLFSRIQPILIPVLMLLALIGAGFVLLRPPDIKGFKADPASVIVGTPVALSWTIDRAKSVNIDPSSGNAQLKPDSGTLKVVPTASTNYTLTARNLVGISSHQSVSVEVKPAPQVPQIASFTASTDHLAKEGLPVTLDWKVTGATKIAITPADEIKDVKDSGEATVHPSQASTVYTLTATNDAGSINATKTIVIDPPQIASFTSSAPSVGQGGTVQLSWVAQNFTKLTIKADKGDVEPQKQEVDVTSLSSQTVNPLQDTEYTLTATNAGGSVTKTVKVAVTALQIALFKADPPSIAKGAQAQLSWSITGAISTTSINIQPDVGVVSPGQTSVLVSPDKTTTYTISVIGPGLSKPIQKTTAVTVGLGAVSIDFVTAAPASIAKGDSATLTFSVQNAKTITITSSDGTFTKTMTASQPSFQGSIAVSPAKTTTYTLTAVNDTGSKAQPATVVVLAPTPTPPPATPAKTAPEASPPPAPKAGG